uniref:Uncharacterized protein n=1 Tax=Anguilla anguilla TaxID=7936 RepID=A0A0E9QTQ4_ANGAN
MHVNNRTVRLQSEFNKKMRSMEFCGCHCDLKVKLIALPWFQDHP